ncbi:MAG TPA: glycosyltransferase family 2 protein [Bryobacteraceae bacterium]|nr:glycosyltransferase family 2 protein [Bryobacteraceae bacterium]
MTPLVSILIPAYNAQEWIRETLRSAVTQTWERKEIIVVDDGSTDGTNSIVREFESAGVRVISQKNQGAAAARNAAFAVSQGDYIQWLDADDILDPAKIALQMSEIEKGIGRRTILSSAWGKFLYRCHRAQFESSALWCDLSPLEWLLRKMGQNLYMQTATWLVSRELSEAAGIWDTRLLGDDDGEYFCRVLLASDGTRFVRGSRVYYRSSGATSLSYIGHSNRKLDAQWISMLLHIGYLRSLEDSSRVRDACIRYLQNWMTFFYPTRLDIFAKAEEIARELGGSLQAPRLSWKYSWINALFGWRLARRAQVFFPGVRWSLAAWLEKSFSRPDYLTPASTL